MAVTTVGTWLAIKDVSWCQEQDEGPAFRIADSVELGVSAPLGAADAMGVGDHLKARIFDHFPRLVVVGRVAAVA